MNTLEGIAQKRRFYIGQTNATVAATFSASRNIVLGGAAFSFLGGGKMFNVLESVFVNTSYDLIASPGQFVSVGASCTLDGLNDAGGKFCRTESGLISTLRFSDRIHYNELGIIIGFGNPTLTITAIIEPGTGIAAASINSVRLQYSIGLDVYDNEAVRKFNL